jgi:hypothetical protein
MSSTFKVFLDKMGGTDVTQYIGRNGEVFYDPVTGFQRIADGHTPGGTLLNMIGRQGYCLTAYDTATQTNAASINKFQFNVVDISDGITIVGGSKITFAHTGRYNIQFSFQIDKLDAGEDDIEIWLMRDGANVAWSNTHITLPKNGSKAVAAWNFVIDVTAVGQYAEIAWNSADVDMRIPASPAETTPARPGTPSTILTVTQV